MDTDRISQQARPGRMAQEFGDHPDTTYRRMRWVRQLIAQDACRQAPETGHERDL
jgi:hypothetical protein